MKTLVFFSFVFIRYVEQNVLEKHNLSRGEISLDKTIVVDKSAELMYAVEKGHDDKVKDLCKKSKNQSNLRFRRTNSIGQNALHVASKYGRMMIIFELLTNLESLDLEFDVKDNEGQNWLNLARGKRHPHITETLMENFDVTTFIQRSVAKPIHYCTSINDKRNVLELLLNDSSEVNAKDGGGRTPLHIASEMGYVQMTIFLIMMGADVNAGDEKGYTPLHLATIKGKVEVMKILIKNSANVNAANIDNGNTALHLAVDAGHEKIIKILLMEKANFIAKNKNSQMPLHLAAKKGNLKIATVLTEVGSRVVQDIEGCNPIHYAIRNNNIDIVKLLLKSNTFDALFLNTICPLKCSVEQGYPHMARLLLQKGAPVNSGDKNKNTAMHFAAIEDKPEIGKVLTEFRADINLQNELEDTPLHLAALHGNLSMAKFLVHSNAKTELKNKDGLTPLEVSMKNGQSKVFEFLFQNAQLRQSTYYLTSLLHYSSEVGQLGITKLLLEKYDIDVEAEDDNGMTPLHISSKNGHFELTKYLLKSKNYIFVS